MTYKPRGVRNANPGNIRWGDPWQGLLPVDQRTDPEFCQFVDPSWGIRALARTLIAYQDKHDLRTIRGIISRWAPSNENDTEAYIRAVSRQVGHDADAALDLHSYEHLRPLTEAIIRHECGLGPLKNDNTWYANDVIEVGLQRAGVVREAPAVASVPVTKETIGATTTGVVGVAQVAEVLPAVVDAMTKADSHISSGSLVRIVFAVLLIGAAGFIAWSQVRKYQQGVVA